MLTIYVADLVIFSKMIVYLSAHQCKENAENGCKQNLSGESCNHKIDANRILSVNCRERAPTSNEAKTDEISKNKHGSEEFGAEM